MNDALLRSYMRGLEGCGTLDEASRVGRSLWVRLSGGPAAAVHFVTYDGNGNVWNLVSASTGTETARYEYGPFGEPLRLTGAAAGSNPFRFSTKRTEDATGLVLYEYRAYSPAMGRWLSRDPIVERGGRNLYAFVENSAQSRIDPSGLQSVTCCATACDVQDATEITGAVSVLIPGNDDLGNADEVKEMEKIIKKMIKAACRRRPYMRAAYPVLETAVVVAEKLQEHTHGVKLYTKLVYRVCTEKHCGGLGEIIRKKLGKCSAFHWVTFVSEERLCKPTPAEQHWSKEEAFHSSETARAAESRCIKEHEEDLLRSLQ
ncbi:RHS repeat-associated core domain-containing protein [Limisphaera ngatamarikiensis]|uniref:RHS repeat-associated core domain-containing protein n=1 Tax=Limisphaera ngatamarikiensis TaxID=1324935 RepID=A0A6M1RNA9_9BACT|nr:RHS repeat-associated core domain-containing protein [Limisphaera ngatamarikiensis]NGO38927.1 RHS repeat-associated core domain-containing protein [Limisphaera ngatamarikiensis]